MGGCQRKLIPEPEKALDTMKRLLPFFSSHLLRSVQCKKCIYGQKFNLEYKFSPLWSLESIAQEADLKNNYT